MGMMLLVVACYTVCSLSDKTAVAKIKFNGNEFTFLMAAATAIFMSFTLPFADRHLILGWQAAVCVFLIALSKMLEFQMSAKILEDMSAFELKAWLGLCLFMSYFTDYFMYNEKIKPLCIGFITVTIAGLFLIAKSEGKVNYRKIAVFMVVYLLARFGYGFVIKAATPYISSTLCLYFALVLMAVVLLPFANLKKNLKEKPKGVAFVSLTKIPNVAGLLAENAVIAVSLTNSAFIQPMILVVLFFIGLFKKEEFSRLNLIGSIICTTGIVGFQIANSFF